MDDRRKIDFKQHQLPPVSKGHLIRIVIYVILLTVLSCFIYAIYAREKKVKPVKNPQKIEEIHGITLSDSI